MGDIFENKDGKKACFFLSAVLLLGAALRLSYPGDIEYKFDEQSMFTVTQTAGITQPWPLVGLQTGVGGKHPALGNWIFIALARVTHASTPPDLARAVQWLNILALFTLAFFSLRVVPEMERLPWVWATAFAAVNPFAVLYHRKIWTPCLLPFFCILFWIAWHYRKKRAGAFFWGLMGILLGQIHLSGFFFAGGVWLWTYFHDRQARWGFWLLGSLAGFPPLVPWIRYMTGNPGLGFSWKSLVWILVPRYWSEWITDTFGLGLSHSLEKSHFLEFLGYPLVFGKPTYLVALVHAVLIVTGVLVVLSAKKAGGFRQWIGDSSQTGLMLNSVLLAAGVLLTLSCIVIRRHYLLMSFPLEWVWLSRMGLSDKRRGTRRLALLWAAQLLLSVAFFYYLHVNHGDPAGEYGTAYQFQTR